MRAHPTVRPYALALGVFAEANQADGLAFLAPGMSEDVSAALFADTLGALSTFPVRHRVVFTPGGDAVTKPLRLPATWREVSQRGHTPAERLSSAAEDLLALGAEATLLVLANGPMLPLGPLFDGLMWLLPKGRVVLGQLEGGGLYAFGCAEPPSFLTSSSRSGSSPPGLSKGLVLGDRAEHGEREVVKGKEVLLAAETAGLEIMSLPDSYRIRGRESLQRLKQEVAGGVFAPQCRKLFERADLNAALID